MIDLRRTLSKASEALSNAGLKHALIGGFAMAVYGEFRATVDIDFLADGAKRDEIKKALTDAGFILRFESDEVLQFEGIGFLDVLLANQNLDIQLVKKYADLFGEWKTVEALKK